MKSTNTDKIYQLNVNGKILNTFIGVYDCSEKLGLDAYTIYRAINNKTLVFGTFLSIENKVIEEEMFVSKSDLPCEHTIKTISDISKYKSALIDFLTSNFSKLTESKKVKILNELSTINTFELCQQ